jgi:hypothetical protein
MVSRSSNSSQYQNRVDFCDSGLKNVQSKSSLERTDVRNTKTITYDTISTTTSSNMHEPYCCYIEYPSWLKITTKLQLIDNFQFFLHSGACQNISIAIYS